MSDTPNIVNITIPVGRIEVIDNNKVSSQVIIVDLPNTSVSIDAGDVTTISPVSSDTTTLTTETIRTNIVEVIEPGPQGIKGDTGEQGIQGATGPRGPHGLGVSILGVTSSLHIYNETINDLTSIATGSWWILEDTNDRGNGISGSIGDGLLYTGLPWTNTGRLTGVEGPSGSQGPYIDNTTYNSSNGMLTFELSDGTTLPAVGSIKGQDGDPGNPGSDGVGIDTIAVDSFNLMVKLSNQAAAVSLGNIRGIQGPRGPQGIPGSGGGGSGGPATLSADIVTDTAVGYIGAGTTLSTGTTFQQIMEQMFVAPYVAPIGQFTSVTFKNNGTSIGNSSINYGTGTTFNSVYWNRTTGEGGAVPSLNQIYANRETPALSITGLSDTSSPYTFSSKTLYKDSSTFSTNHTFEGKVKVIKTDGGNQYITGFTKTVKTPKYFGATSTNANAGSSNSTFTTILNSIKGQETEWDTTKSSTFTGNANTTSVTKYTYFAIPSYYGNITSVYASSNPGTNQYNAVSQIKTDFSYTVGSQTLTFDIYKFNNLAAIPSGEGITVS